MRSISSLLLIALALVPLQADERPRLDSLGDPLPAHAAARLGTIRWRRAWYNGMLVYTSAGKLLGGGVGEDGVSFWDLAEGKQLRHWPGIKPYSLGRSTALSADGHILAAVGDQDLTVQTFDVEDGKARRAWTVPERIYGMALSPDGKFLVTIHWEKNVRLWDTASAEELRLFKHAAASAAFTPDGKTLLIGNDKRVRIWEVATGKELRRLEGNADFLALSGDGKTAAGMGKEGLHIWDTTTGKLRRTIEADLDRPVGVALSADGRTIAFAHNSLLRAWDTATGAERFRTEGAFYRSALALSADGQTLAWTTMEKVLRWDLARGREIVPCPGHQGNLFSLSFSPDSKRLVSRADDNLVHLWKLGAGQPELVRTLRGDRSNYIIGWKVRHSPDGKLLAVPGWDNVRLLDAETGKELRKFPAASGHPGRIAFSSDGKLLAIGGDGRSQSGRTRGRVELWEVENGKLARTIEDHGEYLHALAFSPDGKTIALGSDAVRLWDVTTGEHTRRFPGRAAHVLFTPDGRTLIASGESVTLWDVKTGNEARQLDAGNSPALAVSHDGKLLATGGGQAVRLWDIATGAELIQLPGHLDRVGVLAFSQDGKWLASGSNDTTILLWDLQAVLAAAARKAKKAEPTKLDAPWADLAKADAAAAHSAVWAFIAEADRAVAFLNKHLQPAGEADNGDLLVPAGEPLRRVRAVEVLERIGTPEARALLEKLSKGPVSRTSREAGAALGRLDRLKVTPIKLRSELTEAERLVLWWKELGEANAAAGHDAVWGMVRAPGPAVALLKARLRPAQQKQPADSPLIVPAGDELRGIRAIMVLERIGSVDARTMLESLSKGAPGRMTDDARAALERLDQRTRAKP
jgi:WD40 repeat protein